MIAKLLSAAETTSRIFVWLGGGLIILSAFLVTLEVILRKLFNTSIGGADELSGYGFAIATTLAMAYALLERAHIRVDALYNLFPLRLKVFASLLGLALLIGFAGVITVMAGGMVLDSLAHGSRSITPMRTPLALPQLPWLLGWVFFLLVGLLLLVAALKAVVTGDPEGADALIGTKSIDEQVEDERI